jgi:hypothetical protein
MSAQRHADEIEAGFDPAALLRYVERRLPVDRPGIVFPIRADRIAGLRQAIRDLPSAVYSESDEFHAIQEQVRAARYRSVSNSPIAAVPKSHCSRHIANRKPNRKSTRNWHNHRQKAVQIRRGNS